MVGMRVVRVCGRNEGGEWYVGGMRVVSGMWEGEWYVRSISTVISIIGMWR